MVPALSHVEIKAALLSSDSIYILRQEFRSHLEQFYAHLNLAPPYHSIEKALQYLSNTLRTKPEDFRQEFLQDPAKKWEFFQEIFSASGLQKKHRGIIQQLARSSTYSGASSESLRFLKNFADVSRPSSPDQSDDSTPNKLK